VAGFADGWSAARQSPADFGDVCDRLLTALDDHDRDGRPRAWIMGRCRLGAAHENESPALAGPVASVVDPIDEYRRRGADRITVVDDEFDDRRRFGHEVIDRF
jgi:alkanesulfonate monooxygenase SsuD/methylene tetrahydromethanopterin reductase-like flavin-dependent oxidoreductase (luciferase family)